MTPYTLYTWGTPNGWKAHIILEELGVDYKVEPVNILTNQQKEDWFLAINPNGRIPAIVDHDNGDVNVFETGAIMWYLVEKHDKEGKFWPKDLKDQAKVMSWLMFQMGGVGPMQGQANHFVRFAKPRLPYAMHRYVDETERLYSVMESQLEKTEWLAGDSYTIADMANWCWVAGSAFAGVDFKKYPNLNKWVYKIYDRPAAKKAIRVPTESPVGKFVEDDEIYLKTLNESREKIADADKAAAEQN